MGIFSKRHHVEIDDTVEDVETENRVITAVMEAATVSDLAAVPDDDLDVERQATVVPLSTALRNDPFVPEPHLLPANEGASAFDTQIAAFDQASAELDSVGDLVAALQSRLPDMHSFAARMRRDEARNVEIANQLENYRGTCAALEEQAARQSEKISDLESGLAAAEKLQSTLKTDLIALQAELDTERQSAASLRNRDQELRGELEARSNRIARLEADENRRASEIARLTETKTKLEKLHSQAQRELVQAQCALAERDLKLESLSKTQETLVAEQERSSEERRALRREASLMETNLAEAQIRIDRLKSENEAYVKRLASEKYSMGKDREALVSELQSARTQSESTHIDLVATRDRCEALTRERDEIRQKLAEIEGMVDTRRDELRSANNSISELSLQYAADLLTLDQLRDENRDLRNRIELIQADNKRLYEFEAQFKSAENRAQELEAKLAEHIQAGDRGVPKKAPTRKVAKPKMEETSLPPTADMPEKADTVTKH